MRTIDWDRLSTLIDITPGGAIQYQTIIAREFPDIDRERLHACIEDHIKYEEIQWPSVREDYETEGVGVDD